LFQLKWGIKKVDLFKTHFLKMKIILSILLYCIHFICLAQSDKIRNLELIRLKLENKYGWIGDFDTISNVATVYLQGNMGYIDTSGKLVLPLGRYKTNAFFNDIGIYSEKNEIKAIDRNGRIIKDFPLLIGHSGFEKSVAKVNDIHNGLEKYGIMDKKGNILIPCKYEFIEKISENYFYVNNNTGSGIINLKGDTIIPMNYIIDYIDTTNLHFIGYHQEKGHAIFYPDGTVKKFLGKNIYIEKTYIDGKYYYQRDSIIIVRDKFTDENCKYGLVNLNFDTIVSLGRYFYLSDINEGMIKFSEIVTKNDIGQQTNQYKDV
jgi:hypothetical protein